MDQVRDGNCPVMEFVESEKLGVFLRGQEIRNGLVVLVR